MAYIDLFLDTKKPIVKRTVRAVEADWNFVHHVFPEEGFLTYFPGFVVSRLAAQLKQNNINTAHERYNDPRVANISRFLSDIDFVRRADLRNDR